MDSRSDAVSEDFQPRLNAVERALRIFTRVEPGEGTAALLMAFNIFVISTSYYLLKPAREAFMSLNPDGALQASYASAVMAVILVPFIWIYGKLGRKLDRRKFVAGLTAFFVSNLVLFYFLALSPSAYLGPVFFVWLGIFNLSVIAQFWAYGNDIYTREQGKRLFPLIMLGQNAGAILGAQSAKMVVQWSGSTASMLWVAALVLVVSIFLTLATEWAISNRPRASKAPPPQETLGATGGFELVYRHRYLLYIALLIMVLNTVNTTGEFILRSSVFEAARESSQQVDIFVAQYYAGFFRWVNILAVLIQALLVSRILHFLGVRGALLIPPMIALLGYGAISAVPLLLVVTVAKTVENSTDYALMNTLRAALFLPTSREMKYKAKQAIDTFFVRFGDVLSAGVVTAGVWLGLGVSGFGLLVLGAVAIWFALAFGIRRQHEVIASETDTEA